MKTNEALILSMEQQKKGWLVFFRFKCEHCGIVNKIPNPFEFTESVQCGRCLKFQSPEEVFVTLRRKAGVLCAQ